MTKNASYDTVGEKMKNVMFIPGGENKSNFYFKGTQGLFLGISHRGNFDRVSDKWDRSINRNEKEGK